MAKAIETIDDLFPSPWLHSDDLQGRVAKVKIVAVTFEDMRQPDGKTVVSGVLAFEGKQKRLVLNRTQARALVQVLGSERLQAWVGGVIALAPGRAPNGKATVQILAAETGESEQESGQSG